MSQGQKKPPREYDITDDKKLMLWGPPIRPDGFPIRCKFSIDENGPVMEFDSGTKTEKGFTVDVKMPIAPRDMRLLLNIIEKTASFKGGDLAFEMDVWGHPWVYNREQGKNIKSKEKLLLGRLMISKRSDGLVSLSVASKNKPEMRFEFSHSDYVGLTQNGQAVPVSITSPEAAIAWAGLWRDVLTQHIERNWKEPDYQREYRMNKAAERAQKFGGGGGGGNRNYNGGGGGNGGGNNYQQRPQQQQQAAPAQEAPGSDGFDSFDEDVLF